MSDETGGFAALPDFFVSLGHGVDVHGAVIGAHGQVGAVRGELHLVDHLLAVLDVNHLGHVPARGTRATAKPATGNPQMRRGISTSLFLKLIFFFVDNFLFLPLILSIF